jgi:hypothetical protein
VRLGSNRGASGGSSAETTEHTLGSIEQVDGGVSIGDHEALESKTLEELSLHLRTSLSDRLDGVGTDSADDSLELARLDGSELTSTVKLEGVESLLVGDLSLLTSLVQLKLSLVLDLGSLGLELSLLNSSLTLDGGGFGASLSLGSGLTSGLDGSTLGLQLEQILLGLLSLSLVEELLTLKTTTSLLLTTLSLVTGGGLLGLGGDLDSELNGLLKSVTSTLINGLNRLDINVGDHQIIGSEDESVQDLVAIGSKDGLADDGGRVLVEVIERLLGNGTTDARGNGLASVTDKIGNLEQVGELLSVLAVSQLEVPVVRKLQRETSVISSLNDNDVGHEIRAEQESDGLDNVGTLGLVTREGENSEVLLRAQNNQLGTKDNARLLGLVIIDLNGRVVGSAEGNNASAVTLLSLLGSGVGIALSNRVQELLDNRREVLLPELLVGGEHVGLANNRANLTGLDVTDIDTLVQVKRNGTTTLQDLNGNVGDIIAGTIDHPTVTRATLLLAINKGLTSTEQESLLRVQHVNVLDASLELLSGVEEEGNLTLAQQTLTHGLLAINNGVKNNAILTRAENGDVHLANNLLVDVRDVSLSHLDGHQPLLTGLALSAKDISEGAESLEVESLAIGQNVGRHGLDDFLLNVGQVGTRLTDEPFITSLANNILLILKLLTGAQVERLVGLDDDGANNLDDLNLNTRDIGAGTLEEPFITSNASSLGDSVVKVADATQAERSVGGNNLQWANLAVQLLSREKREGILLEADLLISVTDANLSVGVGNQRVIGVSLDWVLDDAVVTRRDHDHGLRTSHELLMLLTSEGLRTTLNASHVGVVIQNMDVVVWLDANHCSVGGHVDTILSKG